MHCVLETLPYYYASSRLISIGNNIYILVYRVVKGPIVKRGYFSSRRKDSKAESD